MPSFFKDLGKYALGQIANNLPTVLTAGGIVVGGVVDKTRLPSPLKTFIKGTLAASLTVLTHNGSSPAKPNESVVQRALHRNTSKA